MLLAGFGWLIFRVLAGPNVWDFQFFLSVKSPRDASLAAGTWTVGYTLRWIIACSFLVLGIVHLGSSAGFDAEKIMPLVLKKLPIGLQGIFMAVLLAALMSTLSAMINVTSSVVTNDFLARYWAKNMTGKQLVRAGQLASVGAITLGFVFSLAFNDIVSAWETMIFVVVTMILVPSTCRWHWWRFSAKAFVWSMIATAAFIVFQKAGLPGMGRGADAGRRYLRILRADPRDRRFHETRGDGYARRVLLRRSVPSGSGGRCGAKPKPADSSRRNDKMPMMDVLNGGLTRDLPGLPRPHPVLHVPAHMGHDVALDRDRPDAGGDPVFHLVQESPFT